MELELDDGLFWLPTEFLNDDDDDDDENLFSGKNSDLSSPVESVFGTESDEEDYLNDLSRKLAQSTLEDENRHMKSTNVMAGSPQSTLCGYNGTANTRSSPAKAQISNEFSLDALRIAAGEVARPEMAQPKKIENFKNYHIHQIHAAQLKQQQLMKQQLMKQQQYQYQQQLVQQNRGRNGGGVNMKPVAAPLSAWPTLQHYQLPPPPPPGTGMRAVFLGNPNLKRESTGTGVFLPRQIGAPTETRKKKGCSTVLLPDKVIHALNMNLDAQTRSNGPHFPNNCDAEMRYRKNVLIAEQRRQEVAKDFRLPPEWTY